MMPRSKVTAKYQVTIPKEVREKTGVQAGETVTLEAVSEEEIVLRRTLRVRDPLATLIGSRQSSQAVAIERLEEMAESG